MKKFFPVALGLLLTVGAIFAYTPVTYAHGCGGGGGGGHYGYHDGNGCPYNGSNDCPYYR